MYIGQGISLGAWGVKLYYLIMPRTATLTLPKEITGAKGVLDLWWRVQKRWLCWMRKVVVSACVSLLFLSLTRTSCLAGGYTSDVLQNYWRGGTRSRGSFHSSIENWVDRPLNLTCWRKQSSLLHFNWLAQLWLPFVWIHASLKHTLAWLLYLTQHGLILLFMRHLRRSTTHFFFTDPFTILLMPSAQ